VPGLVRILYDRLGHTSGIGHYAEGELFADAGTLPPPMNRYYTVLHLFDDDGSHVDSVVELTASESAPARRRLGHLMDGLADIWLADVAIRPFRL
jgi:hypothetical protein